MKWEQESRNSGSHAGQFSFGGKDEVEIIPLEIRMKMKGSSHDNDLDNGVVTTNGFLKSFFNIGLSTKVTSTTTVSGVVLVGAFVDDGWKTCSVAIAAHVKDL
jgi:hypothetical protein